MDIVNISIDDIVPYENNARQNKETVKVVEKSIKKYGFNQPLAVREVNGKYEIIVGHTRYYAALNLGRKSLPCLIVDLDEDKVKQYRIVDNKVAENSRWDNGKLIRELQTMDDPFDIEDFFPEGLVKLLGDYSTSAELANLSIDVKGPIHYQSTGPEQPKPVEIPASEIVAVDTENSSVPDDNSLSEKELAEFEKQKENFDARVRDIQLVREIHNREYQEVVCPQCGKKFLIKKFK